MKTMSAFGMDVSDQNPVLREVLVADGEWALLLELPVEATCFDERAAEELWDQLLLVGTIRQKLSKFVLAKA